FHSGDKNLGLSAAAKLIPPAHSPIPPAIALALLAELLLVETSSPQFRTVRPPGRTALVGGVGGLDFDPSRPNFNSLRKCQRRKTNDSCCGYSECISAHSIPPAFFKEG